MQLKVFVPGDDDPALYESNQVTVKSFRDIVAIGHKVARAVRDWLRQVPMTPHVKQKNFYISAVWVEAGPVPSNPGSESETEVPKRKRKARKGK